MSPPGRRRRAVLHVAGAALAGGVAGCLSSSDGADDGNTAEPTTPETTRRTRTTDPGSTDDSPTRGTTIGEATHPIDLRVSNDDDATHRVAVTVRHDGEVTAKRETVLDPGDATTIPGALTYPDRGERVYEVTLRLGDSEVSERFRIDAVHVVHGVVAELTGDGVDWSTVVH